VTTVLFDLDGTLVDSLPGIAAGTNAVLGTSFSSEEIRQYVGPPLHGTFATLTGRDDVDDLVAEYRDVYASLMVSGSVVFDGVVAALKQLSEEAVTMAVATSKAQPLAVGLLEGLGLASFFDAVCGPVPPARDDKAATIADALGALGTPPAESVTMVGDRVHDIDGAHAHGLRAVGVTWGFGAPGELRDADVLVDTPAELVAVLLGREREQPRGSLEDVV
jgi:phosphoglycolate phosphatase